MQFIAECYKAHKLINKIVYVCLSVYLIQFLIAQEIWDKVVFKDPFSTKLFPRKIWLKNCDKAADAFLLARKFISNWFVTKSD